MTAPAEVRPAQPIVLPDRRASRGQAHPANRMPWHPLDNPFGVAGVLIPGPELGQFEQTGGAW